MLSWGRWQVSRCQIQRDVPGHRLSQCKYSLPHLIAFRIIESSAQLNRKPWTGSHNLCNKRPADTNFERHWHHFADLRSLWDVCGPAESHYQYFFSRPSSTLFAIFCPFLADGSRPYAVRRTGHAQLVRWYSQVRGRQFSTFLDAVTSRLSATLIINHSRYPPSKLLERI